MAGVDGRLQAPTGRITDGLAGSKCKRRPRAPRRIALRRLEHGALGQGQGLRREAAHRAPSQTLPGSCNEVRHAVGQAGG